MRSTGSLILIGGIVVGAVATLAMGCIEINIAIDCDVNLNCPSGPSGSGSSSSSSGTGGDDGGPPASCIPSTNEEPVANSCGVFVSSSLGADDMDVKRGTKEKPFKSISAALIALDGKPMYVCGEAFSETVTISAATTLFGGLDCANGWVYDAAKKTQLTAAADAIPMMVTSSADGTEIHDFAITAADATTAGGSSIALLADHANLTLENVDLVAGAGAAGAPGAAQMQVMTPATAKGTDGTDDALCNVASNISGGPGGTNMCNGTTTNGGSGGKGLAASVGDPGGDGVPFMAPGNGGSGQTSMASCKLGQPGTDGGVVSAGTGAHGIGDLSTSGYQAPMAALGDFGFPGQGGGGGGGARACDVPVNMFAGPSGGGGGAGGCGGAPGNPGQSGGSSIGILVLSAQLTLTTVAITTHDGGKGGLGGDGQLGGNGGLPGHAIGGAACDGGKGGQGGAGGPGGGGAGGHSAAIAIKGGKLPDLASTTIMLGKGAPGGAGGDMDMTAQTKGDVGLGCKTLDFTNPLSPTACAM